MFLTLKIAIYAVGGALSLLLVIVLLQLCIADYHAGNIKLRSGLIISITLQLSLIALQDFSS